jgi:hypothetical protein
MQRRQILPDSVHRVGSPPDPVRVPGRSIISRSRSGTDGVPPWHRLASAGRILAALAEGIDQVPIAGGWICPRQSGRKRSRC